MNNDIMILILVCTKDKNYMYTFFVYKCLNSVKIMKEIEGF